MNKQMSTHHVCVCNVYHNLLQIKLVSNESIRSTKINEVGKKSSFTVTYIDSTKSMKIAALETIQYDTIYKSDRVKYEAEQIKQMYGTNAIFINNNNKKT